MDKTHGNHIPTVRQSIRLLFKSSSSWISENRFCTAVGTVVTVAVVGSAFWTFRRMYSSRRKSKPLKEVVDDEMESPEPILALDNIDNDPNLHKYEIVIDLVLVLTILIFALLVQIHPNTVLYLSPGIFWFLKRLLETNRSDIFFCLSHRQAQRIDTFSSSEHEVSMGLRAIEQRVFEFPLEIPENFTTFAHIHYFVFPYKWEFVIQKMWLRFPDPGVPDISAKLISENQESVERENVTIRHREFKVPNKFPSILKAMLSDEYLLADEKSIEYQNRKYLKCQLVNQSYRNIAISVTNIEYLVHPRNPEWTLLRQTGGVKIGDSAGWFKGAIASFAESSFEKEAKDNSIQLKEFLSRC